MKYIAVAIVMGLVGANIALMILKSEEQSRVEHVKELIENLDSRGKLENVLCEVELMEVRERNDQLHNHLEQCWCEE